MENREMRNSILIAGFLLVLSFDIASGQTALDVEKKYGKPVHAHPVSEYVWMTPEYAADGQICRAILYHKRISTETNYLGTYMPMWELLDIFDELAPPNTRGAKKEYFGSTQTSSSMAWTTFAYEKVTFRLVIGFQFGSLADMKEKGVPFGGRTPAMTNQPDAEFMAQNAVKPEIAYVVWNERKCAGQ
jgi:hypothetical protein